MTSCEIWSASTLTATVQNATPLEAEKEARHARKDVSGESGRAGIPANADGGRAVPNSPGRRHTEGPSDGDSLDRTALLEMGRYLTEKFPAARRTRSERSLTPPRSRRPTHPHRCGERNGYRNRTRAVQAARKEAHHASTASETGNTEIAGDRRSIRAELRG